MMRPMRASSSTTESAYLLLDIDLWMKSGCGMFGWCTFMKLTFMKNGSVGLGVLVEIVERRLLDIAVEERNADDALAAGVSTYWPLILKSSFAGCPALPDSDALGHFLRTSRAARGSMSGNQVGSA